MRSGPFLRRTAAAMLGVLAAISIVHAATAAPPAALLRGIPAAAPPSMDEAADLQGEGRWDEAAEAWNAIAEAEPDNGAAWFNLGYCLHAGGHLDEAIKVHQKAASFDDYHGIALYNLGCAYALSGRSDDAFEALFASMAGGFDVADHVDGDSDLDSLRGDAHYRMLLDSSRAGGGAGGGGGGGMAPGNPIEQIMMGVQQFMEHQLPQIQRQIEMIVHQAMEHVHQMLGEIHQKMAQDERFSMLAERFEQMFGGDAHGGDGRPMPREMKTLDEPPIIELPPDESPSSRPDARPSADAGGLLERAQSLQRGGQWLDAADAFEAAAAADPDNAAAWFGRAYCLHIGKDYERAVVAHRKAASFEETRGVALYNLGCASAILGKLDDAMMALNEARRVGFDLADPIANDSDLDNLRDDPRFHKLLAELGVDY